MLLIAPSSNEAFVHSFAGGKASRLWSLNRAGLPVPAWVALEPEVFHRFLVQADLIPRLEALCARALGRGEPVEAEVERLFLEAPLAVDVLTCVRAARQSLAAQRLAVRSSAIDEDGACHSFAGQFATFLGVETEEELIVALRRCWASSLSDRSLQYRRQRSLPPRIGAMSVILQALVPARASGVLFTCDPVHGDATRHILHAVPGLGEGYVSGALDPDVWELEAQSGAILHAEPAPARKVGEISLAAPEVQALARLGRRVEAIFHRPMDIEWAADAAGHPWLLQARPVTTPVASRAARLQIWDNSNIVESYGGLTRPLTFHFARHAYHQVYVQFCEVLGVRPRELREMDPWLRHMLGILDGRVYYNLLNWYRLTSLLPGYRHNRTFMEGMMGTNRALEAEIAERVRPPAFSATWSGRLRRLRAGLRFLGFHVRSAALVQRFLRWFDAESAPWLEKDLRHRPAEEILSEYHELERVMLWNWKAPIINDYLCMVHHGILRRLSARWLGHLGATFPNDLLAGDGHLASAEPTRELIRLAAAVHADPELEHLLLATDDGRCLEALRQSSRTAIYARVLAYIRRYGFRCMSELKLEQRDLHQEPGQLFVFLKNLLRAGQTDLAAYEQREQRIRSEAERRLAAELHGWRRWVYRWSLHHARLTVRQRENTRFCRTQAYGIVRRMFWAIGADLAARGILSRDEDVFDLTLEEVEGALEGACSVPRLKELVALRQAEYARYAAREVDSRVVTRGAVYWNNAFHAAPPHRPTDAAARQTPGAPALLRGQGCCPGIVEGTVKVVRDAGDDLQLNGDILVAPRTDPGWIPLYPCISGLLVERGGLLSHSAIVAREMGLPTIVGVEGLLRTLSTGMRVRIDGGTGTIDIL